MEETAAHKNNKQVVLSAEVLLKKPPPPPNEANARPAPDNSHARSKISPSRLPSKKRKSSLDSSQQSVKSDRGSTATTRAYQDSKKINSKENEKSDPKNDSKEAQKGTTEKKDSSKKPSPTSAETSNASGGPVRRSRQNSADTLGIGGIRKDSSGEGAHLASPGSSPARLRLRSGSQGSFESPARVRLRSGSQASMDSISSSRPRLRAGSHTSLDSIARRLRSGSTASMDDPFFRRKFSTDLDAFGLPRKLSNDHSVKLDVLMDLPPPEPLNINPKIGEFEVNATRPRSSSTASLATEGLAGGALEHLDALADDAKPPAKKRRDGAEAAAAAASLAATDDNSSAAETFASSGRRVLMEAIKLTTGDGDHSSKEGSHDLHLPGRSRLESWGGSGRERFESMGSALEAAAAAALNDRGRDRLESWGGMSDLSLNFGASAGGSSAERGVSSAAAAAAAAAAAVADHFELAGGGAEDVVGLGLFEEGSRQRASSIPSKISLGRDRFNSIASFSDTSFLPEGAEVTIDLNSIVQAAMAHVGDLAELAGIVETVAAVGSDGEGREAEASEASSVASPMIGATLEGAGTQRPRSLSTSSKLSVDYEALAAAVDAAQAAAGNIDLDALGLGLGLGRADEGSSTEGRSRRENRRWRRQLPLKRDRTASEEASEQERATGVQLSEKELERIRKRARLAASGKPPSSKTPSPSKKQSVPIKKRVKRQNSSPPQADEPISSSSPVQTPPASNKAIAAADEIPDMPISSVEKSASKGQASQKWDSMFLALLVYIEERRQEETVDFSEEERKEWSWDGNVPTTYKTPDGKALGRWVNNQRSAKSKGTLKADREERLVDAGLKWSVLASNSWNETLDELRKYIEEQTKDGKEWDGNVPTHYQIKAKPNGKFAGEDKNLGRWVNRQRSLYQAGKLRKDRQLELEKLGLKWSMLSSTSWDAMFETLQVYVAERKSKEGSWDGNVPANYRTMDNPPRALGRWINRQRSAHTKRKLKAEYVEQLNSIGLKWSVHEKNLAGRPTPYGNENEQEKPGLKTNLVAEKVVSNTETADKEPQVSDKPTSGTDTAEQKKAATTMPPTGTPITV